MSRARARSYLLTALFFPALLPPAVVAAVWVLVYSPASGLIVTVLNALHLGQYAPDWLGDPHLALRALFVAWAWSSIGIATLILWAGLLAIDRHFTEIAQIEGAGALWRFRHVTLPGLRRVLIVVVLVNAALGAQVFDLIFVTTGGGPGYATMILPLEEYGQAFSGQAGPGAAAACVQVLLGVILLALAAMLVRRSGETLDTGQGGNVDDGAKPSWSATALATVCIIVLMLPLVWLFPAALQPGRSFALNGTSLPFDPRQWVGNNFSDVWSLGMGNAVVTSLLLATGVTAATLAVATPAAFAAERLIARTPWKIALLAVLLIGLVQPTPVIVIPLFSLLKNLNLLDSPWGIALPEVGRAIPFAVLILWAFMAQSPREVLDAAAVDGAGPLRQLLRIAVPLARPALFAVAIWSFVSSWNEYLLPTLVSQDGSIQTVPTLLASFLGKFNTEFGLLAAGSLLAVVPSLGIFLMLRRPAASGLARVEQSMR